MPGAVAHATHEYRRAARRLRWIHAGRPAALYRSLRDLSDQYDRICTESSSQSIGSRTIGAIAPSEQFARLVHDQLQNGLLRYSSRVRLIEAAESMGVGRFQANLIIAAVQHQAEPLMTYPAPPGRAHRVHPIIIVLLVQAMILLATWGVFVR